MMLFLSFFRRTIIFILLVFLLLTPRSSEACSYARNLFTKVILHLTPVEVKAVRAFQRLHYITTRKYAEKALRQNPKSYVAHFLMSCILRYSEGELVPSLWHIKQARKYIQMQIYKVPRYIKRIMMFEEISILRQLGRSREALRLIKRYSSIYQSSLDEELLPWIYMKLRNYKKSIALSKYLISKKRFVIDSLNTLCALYFEIGDRQKSVHYCKLAYLTDAKRKSIYSRAIHISNLAEAYLSAFQFHKAERYYLLATNYFHRELNTAPWESLVFIYLDEGRFNDAWNALKKARIWFLKQKPNLSETLYASNQMTQACFFAALGKNELAFKLLEKIRDRPDRHGWTSSKVQQEILGALILRFVVLSQLIEEIDEQNPIASWRKRLKLWSQKRWYQTLKLFTQSKIRKYFLKKDLLRHSLSPYRAGGATLPFRFIAYIIPLVGSTVMEKVLLRLKKEEAYQFPTMEAMLNALLAESAYLQGNYQKALKFSRLALLRLPKLLLPFFLRLQAIRGEIFRRQERYRAMRRMFTLILQQDGSFFRKLHLSLPVQLFNDSSSQDRKFFKILLQSPRFHRSIHGFWIDIHHFNNGVQVVLMDKNRTILSQINVLQKAKESPSKWQKRIFKEVHRQIFSPKTELSRSEIFSLDNSLFKTPTSQIPWKKLFKKMQHK